ncbi:unnamed protein product [Gordionus sp. m RMFG-2023]
MIWEQNCRVILMLTRFNESGKDKCVRYWPTSDSEEKLYGDILVDISNEIHFEHWIETDIKITLGSQFRLVKHFYYKAWPDFGIPQDPDTVLDFILSFRRQIPYGKRPITVHCSAGVGRSGAFICLDRMIQLISHSDCNKIDIFESVKEMRRFRPGMIQNEHQYAFLYRCLGRYLQKYLALPIISDDKNINDDKKSFVETFYAGNSLRTPKSFRLSLPKKGIHRNRTNTYDNCHSDKENVQGNVKMSDGQQDDTPSVNITDVSFIEDGGEANNYLSTPQTCTANRYKDSPKEEQLHHTGENLGKLVNNFDKTDHNFITSDTHLRRQDLDVIEDIMGENVIYSKDIGLIEVVVDSHDNHVIL